MEGTRRLGSNDPRGLVLCTRYGDVDNASGTVGVEPASLSGW